MTPNETQIVMLAHQVMPDGSTGPVIEGGQARFLGETLFPREFIAVPQTDQFGADALPGKWTTVALNQRNTGLAIWELTLMDGLDIDG